jgi:predicted O-linked N-acetylglucosamine transferase (SPINDLY family)
MAEKGFVTFGSFNNPAKLSGATLDLWAALLQRVAESRLVLKGLPFADAGTRDLLLGELARRGVPAYRVSLLGQVAASADHLRLYDEIDIALDPFPYNGTTTTCEALWMGVPVVTLQGDRHAARVGASLLTRVGLTSLIANDPEAYLDIAAGLAADPSGLAELRAGLRTRMASSKLCDGPGFAKRVEAAYRAMSGSQS